MITVRKGHDRGRTQTDWLNSLHTFSFADYYDPNFMGFKSLRVINEDTVQPGFGFGKHPHHDMEIISYVMQGSLEHKDSMGTGSIIKPGEIQVMSAGTGIEHSEFNHSKSNLLHFLQIWIIPEKQGLPPRYEQKAITKNHNDMVLIASPQGQNGGVTIHQHVNLYAAYPLRDSSLEHEFKNKGAGWLQLIQGKILLNGQLLVAGDGAAIQDEPKIKIEVKENAEFLFFDF